MLRSYKVEGVVIKRVNFGEADKLLTVFSKNYGKIKTIAKGVRLLHSRKAPHLEIFNQVTLFLASGRNFDIITEAETLTSFPKLSSQLDRLAYAYQIIEEIDRLCPERQEHNSIYFLLITALKDLEKQEIGSLADISEQFTLKILWELGFLPRGEKKEGETLERFLEQVMERNLQSKAFLTKLDD